MNNAKIVEKQETPIIPMPKTPEEIRQGADHLVKGMKRFDDPLIEEMVSELDDDDPGCFTVGQETTTEQLRKSLELEYLKKVLAIIETHKLDFTEWDEDEQHDLRIACKVANVDSKFWEV